MKFIIETLLIGVAVLLMSYYVPGIQVNGFGWAIAAGLLVGIANATIGAILRLLTFPINIMTLGLMSFIISVLMVLLVDHFLAGFNTSGFLAPIKFAIILSVVKMVIGLFK